MNEPSESTRPGDRAQDEQRAADPPLPDPTSPVGYDGADPGGPSLEKAAPGSTGAEPVHIDPTPTNPNLGAQSPPPWQPPAGQQPWGSQPPPPGQPNPQWQPQWQPQPQRAIRPGVIPLRPLGLSEILDGAISFIRSHPVATIGLSAAVAAVVQLVNLLVGFLTGFPVQPDPTDVERNVERYLAEFSDYFGKSMISAGIGFLGVSVLTGLLIVVLSQAVLGRRMGIAEAWRTVKGRLLGLIGITFLAGLGVAAAMFVGFVPALAASLLDAGPIAIVTLMLLGVLGGFGAAIYLWVCWSLIGPVYVLEHAGVVDSFRRSRRLVQPQWWRIFGTLLLALVIAIIISAIIAVPFLGIASAVSGVAFDGQFSPLGQVISALGAVIAATITTPFQAGVTGLLYFDQRIRREGLDITLQRALDQ
jgi:hypothetical protein